MLVPTQEEGRRASRYVVVKALTKGGGALIYTVTLLLYGDGQLLYAYWAVAALTSLVDFCGQKYWAFRNPLEESKKIWRDFLLFIAIRGSTVYGTTHVVTMLTEDFGLPMWVSFLGALSIFVPIGFLLTRWLFYGSISDLFRSRKNQARLL